MLQNLKKEVQEKGAKVKVGVVLFNKEAHTDGFMDWRPNMRRLKQPFVRKLRVEPIFTQVF